MKNDIYLCLILKYSSSYYIIQNKEDDRFLPGYLTCPTFKIQSDHELDIKLNELLFKKLPLSLTDKDIKLKKYLGKITSSKYFLRKNTQYLYLVELKTLKEKSDNWISLDELKFKLEKGDSLFSPDLKKILFNLKYNTQLSKTDNNNKKFTPIYEPLKNIFIVMPKSHTLPPAQRTNAFILGDYKKVLVDPSPKSIKEFEKFYETIKNFNIKKIFITHYHRDHYEHVDLLAKKLNIPIYLSELTYKYICEFRGNDYFNNTKTIFVSDGDILGASMGEDIIVMDVSGHALGHLALYSRDKKWFVASDLFQGQGSVVVGGAKASMKCYIESLKKVIELNPKTIFPSHGIGLGGVHHLRRILKHREERQRQVDKLYEEGKSIEEITSILYFGISDELKKYAMANVISHLENK